jgi:hypothetical protein
MARPTLFVTVLAFISAALGQQFDGSTFPHELLGLSESCFAAVNRTVSSCPAWLPRYAGLEYVPRLRGTRCEIS